MKHEQLSHCIQELFQMIETNTTEGEFVNEKMRTNAKKFCMSTKEVNVWNKRSEEIKPCMTLCGLKGLFKENNIDKYKMDLHS